MSQLDELYGDIILEHSEDPRNFGKPKEGFDVKHDGFNPICGDQCTLYVKWKEGSTDSSIGSCCFEGKGCSISMASASMMTEAVEGQTRAEAEHMIEQFRNLMQGKGDESPFDGDLKALSGVKRFPVRIKCALLPWMTLKRALDGGCAGAKVDPANHKEGI